MVLYDGPVVDAHHHLWDLGLKAHPWLQRQGAPIAGERLSRSYLIEDYLAEARPEGIVKSVHIQAGWDPADPVAETRWCQAIADRVGFPHGIVGDAPLTDPKIEAVLEAHAAHANMRGIRHILSWHEDPAKRFDLFVDRPDRMRDPAWRRGFALLPRYRMSFDMMLYPGQLGDALDLARAYPEVQIIVNHAGSPIDRDAAGMERWRSGMRALAAAPNVAVKISDLGAYDPQWTAASWRPIVRGLIDWFEPRRCLFASDFPVAGLFGSFAAHYQAFRELVADLSATEQRALFHDNARRYYRLQ
ncbi:MAG: hypothetical protein FJX56_03850 [Alphaproteobacteria bacterium]|nr:hypothetical protein [Alphaproteobacteria bacterium]